MKDTEKTVYRVVRRRAKPGCEKAYEDLLRGMLDESSHFHGYLSATIIPPDSPQGEYQIIQRFSTQKDLDHWDASEERAIWHERLHSLAESDPDYRLLTGLEVWFSPKLVPSSSPPPRWRMTVVSWLGIFPVVTFCLWFISPLLAGLPFLVRTAIITVIVVALMSYVVMPRLSRWMGWWLLKK